MSIIPPHCAHYSNSPQCGHSVGTVWSQYAMYQHNMHGLCAQYVHIVCIILPSGYKKKIGWAAVLHKCWGYVRYEICFRKEGNRAFISTIWLAERMHCTSLARPNVGGLFVFGIRPFGCIGLRRKMGWVPVLQQYGDIADVEYVSQRRGIELAFPQFVWWRGVIAPVWRGQMLGGYLCLVFVPLVVLVCVGLHCLPWLPLSWGGNNNTESQPPPKR